MKQLLSIARVFGLTVVMLGVVLALTLRSAIAQLRESIGGFGQELGKIVTFSSHTAPRKLLLNGLDLRVVTISTPLGVTEALDRFQALCHSAGRIDLPDHVRRQLERGPNASQAEQIGVLRKEGGNEGYLACLDVGASTSGEGLVGRLLEFGKTQNLRSLGQLRYALARRSGATTTLVVVWTEGDARLAELFPKTGDAPGLDLDDVPRPNQSQRLISAYEQGKPFGLVLYRIEGRSRDAVESTYASGLAERGWQLGRSRKPQKDGILVATKAGRTLLVRVAAARAGGTTVLLSDLG